MLPRRLLLLRDGVQVQRVNGPPRAPSEAARPSIGRASFFWYMPSPCAEGDLHYLGCYVLERLGSSIDGGSTLLLWATALWVGAYGKVSRRVRVLLGLSHTGPGRDVLKVPWRCVWITVCESATRRAALCEWR